MRHYALLYNRYSRLERWLSERFDRQINNGREVRWTFKNLNVVGALLMVSVPRELSDVSGYSDFR